MGIFTGAPVPERPSLRHSGWMSTTVTQMVSSRTTPTASPFTAWPSARCGRWGIGQISPVSSLRSSCANWSSRNVTGLPTLENGTQRTTGDARGSNQSVVKHGGGGGGK